MSEAEKPKRKSWQFHLSTAVIVMLVVTAFVGTNMFGHNRMPSNKGRRSPTQTRNRVGMNLPSYQT
jgi:hypothetical protein